MKVVMSASAVLQREDTPTKRGLYSGGWSATGWHYRTPERAMA